MLPPPELKVVTVPVEFAVMAPACVIAPLAVMVRLPVADDVPMVHGHVDALGRALTNVLLNAVEASMPDAPIALSVQRTQRNGRPMVELAVRDVGSGIAPARLSRIFEPYVTNKAGGTGLGLAIVRQTVLAHDGAVEVESAPGAGTTMRLLLPADAPARGLGERHG